ncbi:MAG TPA: rhombosortase [Opitutaceae bacterium]|nr:rhombosortase [Opitutaceae bacterium]
MSPRRLPFLTLALSVLALAISVIPGAAAALQFDRAALAAGGWWRFVAGHWAHWGGEHLAWDLVVFAVFGALLEARSRRGFAVVVAGSALAISAAVALGAPSLDFYRGLSGIDSALFAAFFAQLLGDARRERTVLPALVPAVALLGFVGKSAYELATGATLFVTATGDFVVVPLAHVVGAGVGMAVVATREVFRRATFLRTEPQPT